MPFSLLALFTIPELSISTPALLFPAISLLFLSFTNRFLHLAALIRKLHSDWLAHEDASLLRQIVNLRRRMVLIRLMQLFGALSLLCCVFSMLISTLYIGDEGNFIASLLFVVALVFMSASLICLSREVMFSGGALTILLDDMDAFKKQHAKQSKRSLKSDEPDLEHEDA